MNGKDNHMELTKTKALMAALAEEKKFDTYSVLVGLGQDECAFHSPNADMDTYYDVASMGKVLITATLILRAVGEGRLSLTDTLPKFFRDVPLEKREITVGQLLTHSSGIRRYNVPKEVAANCNDTIAAWILAKPLAYAPGTSYEYSCAGFILLGHIVEKVWGMPYDEAFYLLEKHPLGLRRATFNIALDEPNACVCYRWNDNRLRRMDDEIISVVRNGVSGNGGGFWSAGDMQKYVKAVLTKDPVLYRQDLFAQAERDYTPHFGEGRGLGWLVVDGRYAQTGDLFPAGSFGHCGHTGKSFFIHRPTGLYVILMTNATRFANLANDFRGYDYGKVCALRRQIHNSIYEDLKERLSW